MMIRKFAIFVGVGLLLGGIGSAQEKATTKQRGKATKASAAPAAETNLVAAQFPAGPKLDSVKMHALKPRAIGPAIMGGRVSDIAYDLKETATFYIALGTGGLMKTTDNGATFDGVFENEPVAAIGAVAVAPSDSKVVWVGTGEANDRNSESWGDGVYRSADGGETWARVGLEKSRMIARIVVHPTDPNTAWAAVMGDMWTFGGERGLYKTADGGKSWTRVLAAPAPYDDRTGCGDVAVDPSDPNTMYAALYARQRTPWSFSNGPDLTDGKNIGGIFKSTDGGATWKKLEKGLPGRTGRIGLSLFAKNAKIVYAVVGSDEGGTADIRDVQSKRGGVFRSEDGGETWTRQSGLDPRPFYFSQIRVDPANDQRVYVLGFALHVSDDGGKSWREDLGQKLHPDLHALAIDPRNPKRLLLGTDGGAYQSYNAGQAWEHLNRMAAGEFYRINVDLSTPYRVCGGLQDNENWVGPSRTYTGTGIANQDWQSLGGGDGFYCVFDSENPSVLYTESQEGFIHRIDLSNGQLKVLRPEPAEGQAGFRFHWNTPLVASRHSKDVMYMAGNRVFKLTVRGEQWQSISPDLSAQDLQRARATGSGAENYGVVYSLVESPVKAGLLWAATDDGKVWVTEDEGAHWTDLTANLAAETHGQWMSRIEAGWQDAAVAYLAVDAHRTGNFSPLAYRTGDGGKTWEKISSDLPAAGPVKVVREDPKNPNLLFAGTEFGLFVSFNRGGHWVKFAGLPTVAVDDILVHPRERDLVLATHGRSLYIVDDIRALEEMTADVEAKEAYLFPPRAGFGRHLLPSFVDWGGKAVFAGENPPEGTLLTFYVKELNGEPARVKITNGEGQTVVKMKLTPVPGLNRFSWDLRPSKEVLTEYGGEGAKFVRPGDYTVSITYGKTASTQTLHVEIAAGVETR